MAESGVSPGGVDPLGLRQINFDLMDKVLPGLNNVARHIRPFVVVAWAWRRAKLLAEKRHQLAIDPELFRDFVDRVETIYVWSQFLVDPHADLPGRVALGHILAADSYTFGGEEWARRREVRRYSTGLIAPITYGPALKSLQWILPHPDVTGIFVSNPDLDPVLDAFEAQIKGELGAAALSRFGKVKVQAADVQRWGELWRLNDPTGLEGDATYEALGGTRSNKERRATTRLIELIAEQLDPKDFDVDDLRALMCEPLGRSADSAAAVAANAWRRVQVRQVFRLALEGLFFWLIGRLTGRPQPTASLASAFLGEIESRPSRLKASAREWMNLENVPKANPTEHLKRLEEALNETSDEPLPKVILNSLAYCLSEAPEAESSEPPERLPLYRAKGEFEIWSKLTPQMYISNVIETWVIAQHVFWSVGRGLADARTNGKVILRLRIVMDEGGWTLTPGANSGNAPAPTPDRLATVLSLLKESQRFR